MMKRAFTLIELLISITIFSILLLSLTNFISTLKVGLKTIEKRVDRERESYLFKKVLYFDILNSYKITLENDKNGNAILSLYTSNSLYNLPVANVKWYLKNGKIVRIETPKSFKKRKFEDFYYIDSFLKGITKFRIYRRGNKFLIFLKKDVKFIYWEVDYML